MICNRNRCLAFGSLSIVVLLIATITLTGRNRSSSSDESDFGSILNYINQLKSNLTSECSKYSSAFWEYKSDNTDTNFLLNYLHSLTNYEYYVQAQSRPLNAMAAATSNQTLKSLVRKLHSKRHKWSSTQFFTLQQLQQTYQNSYDEYAEFPQKQLTDNEEWEQENGGQHDPKNVAKRVSLNSKIWINFHNKFGGFVQDNIAPKHVEIMRSQLDTEQYKSYYSGLDDILEQISPLYMQLHAYVRGSAFSSTNISKSSDSAIPVHLINSFGNWFYYKEESSPFDQLHMGHVSYNIKRKRFRSEMELLKVVNQLFVSLNLTLALGQGNQLPAGFWKDSIFLSSILNFDDEFEVGSTCDESLADICELENYKAIFCSGKNYENFRDFHRKLGSVYYMMLAKPKFGLRQGGIHSLLYQANEALWDLFATSPQYLDRLGLWQHVDWKRQDSEPLAISSTLNFQYSQVLQTIPAMVEFIVVKKWEHEILTGQFDVAHANCKYWQLREKYEGIEPPETRANSQMDGFKVFDGFDDGYEYFYGQILAYQLHRKICSAVGQSIGQQCDISENQIAGNLLRKFMSADTSKSWTDILYETIGTSKVSVDAMMQFFKPIHEFLVKFNADNNYTVDWQKNKKFNNPNKYQGCM